jgi:hypothetical protein
MSTSTLPAAGPVEGERWRDAALELLRDRRAARQLAGLLLIHRAGLSRSVRPQVHGRDLPLWAVTDRAAAVAWLAAHPDLEDPTIPDNQPLLFE